MPILSRAVSGHIDTVPQSKRQPAAWCECCVMRDRWQPSRRIRLPPSAQQEKADKTGDSAEKVMDAVRSMRVSIGKRFRDSWDLDVSGGFRTVRKATHKTGAVGAVKRVPKRNLRFNLVVRHEMLLLRSIKHPQVCKLFDPFEEEGCYYMVMEYVEGWELFDGVFDLIRKGTFNEQVCSAIMHQLFDGLHHCHTKGIVHRDLRPSNIMIVKPQNNGKDENRISMKLVNFGVHVPFQSLGGCSTQLEKATAFRSPEARESGTFSMASDIWSMGALLFVMVVGRIPCAFGWHDQLKEVVSGIASDPLRNLLSDLLHEDPSDRISTSKALQHPWMADVSRDTTTHQEHANLMSESAFTTFYQHDKLHTAVLAAMDSEVAGHQICTLWDKLHAKSEGSGIDSRENLLAALKTASVGMRVGFFCSQIEQLEEEIASEGFGLVRLDTWKMTTLQAFTCAASEAAEAAFHALDLSGSGSVPLADLCKILKVTSGDLVRQASSGGIRLQVSIDFEAFKATLSMLAETAIATDNGGSPARSPRLLRRLKADTPLSPQGGGCTRTQSAPALGIRRRSLTAYDCPASLLKISGALGKTQSRSRFVAFEKEAQVVLIPETPASLCNNQLSLR